MEAGLTAAQAIGAVDWSRPWLACYRDVGLRLASHVAHGASVAEALNAERHAPTLPRFVPQPTLPEGEAYEAFIGRTDSVPTRDNLHDFFNGLVWLHHEALKRQMNQAQAAAIAQQGVGSVRGAVRDALTVLDENGALLEAPSPLAEALRRRDWRSAFVEQRALWRAARLQLIGHALLEKLVQPRKAITAHVLFMPQEPRLVAALTTAAFTPLPVLGVPGWWPANESPAFYDDASVFRPAGSLRPTGSARRCRS